MKNIKLTKILLVVSVATAVSGINAQEVFAKKHSESSFRKEGHRDVYKQRHHPYYGRKVSLPSLILSAIFVSGREYYYYQGMFYQKARDNYIIVDAPIGARVNVLPLGSVRVIINGRRYYYYNGVYFEKKPLGYFVVDDPVYRVVDLPQQIKFVDNGMYVSTGQTQEKAQGEEYVVNILNANGSYTQVKIVQSDDGFLGPQGEYYTEFPKVAQLKVMYGK